jgi:hypothetical protein
MARSSGSSLWSAFDGRHANLFALLLALTTGCSARTTAFFISTNARDQGLSRRLATSRVALHMFALTSHTY